MLAALLPLLESLGAEGGAAAALGGGEGIAGTLGRLIGGSKSFGSEKELGEGLRKISDLHSSIEAAKEAMAEKSNRQEDIAQKARDDEKQYAFSDPAHTQQLADLAKQQQAHQEEIRRSSREMNDLRGRAAVSTDPSARRAQGFSQAAAIVGVGAAVKQFAPKIIQNLPPVKAAANVAEAGANIASNFVTPTAGNVISGMGQDAANIAKSAFNPGQLMVQLSKLPQHITSWSEALVESQRSISRFNGVLAMSFAQQERRGLVRAIQSGERTGGATADLSNEMQNLYDLLQPTKDAVTNTLARGLTKGVQILEAQFKVLQVLADVAVAIASKFAPAVLTKTIADALAAASRTDDKGRQSSTQIGQAFEEALKRDKRKRLGVAKR